MSGNHFYQNPFQPAGNFEQQLSPTELFDRDVLISNFKTILENGIHGICFSLYEDGQKPGDVVTEEQIIKRLAILKKHTNWIRVFSCTQGNEQIAILAKQMGFQTLVGAWLETDNERNDAEIEALIELANRGLVDIAAVGNEVLYRKELEVDSLIEMIQKVKSKLPNIPVGYVDAYYEFVQHPDLMNACDVILSNCYPFWEGTPIDHSFAHLVDMFGKLKNIANGKRIIITETGWPSNGEPVKGAQPSELNALRYFVEMQRWVTEERIESFYFSSFDEAWKSSSEGILGAYWGLWDAKGKLKYVEK